jgi:UDP-3-O-[3-hydroxymyristoyl] N-acetylglucosamine deacetylase
MQTTIAKPASTSGIGLHTGCHVSITLRPAPPRTGIVFRRVDLHGFEIEARRKWVSRVVLATTLMKRGVMLSTVEHVLSAIYGCGIDNLYVDIDSLELPILDGSARPFVELIEAAGIAEQSAERTFLVVERTVRLEERGKFVMIEPSDQLSISYAIDFDHPAIGRQSIDLVLTRKSYTQEIAFARTFGFYREVEDLRRKGLIRGGSLENAVVLDESGVMNGELRAPDEFVRHKVLDLIGDVSLCGSPLLGRITAYRAGHSLHTNLATKISRSEGTVRRVAESELQLGEAVNL